MSVKPEAPLQGRLAVLLTAHNVPKPYLRSRHATFCVPTAGFVPPPPDASGFVTLCPPQWRLMGPPGVRPTRGLGWGRGARRGGRG
jgi:hypothetical protein